jgi:hypothetical protein
VAAGVLGSTLETVESAVRTWKPSAKRIAKASTMLTAGPAPITTIRFQTGCS